MNNSHPMPTLWPSWLVDRMRQYAGPSVWPQPIYYEIWDNVDSFAHYAVCHGVGIHEGRKMAIVENESRHITLAKPTIMVALAPHPVEPGRIRWFPRVDIDRTSEGVRILYTVRVVAHSVIFPPTQSHDLRHAMQLAQDQLDAHLTGRGGGE